MSRQEDGKYAAAERSADRSTRATAAAHRQRRDRYSSYVHKLAQEYKNQATARAFTIKRLQQERNHWFAGSPLISHCSLNYSADQHVSPHHLSCVDTKAATLINALIEYCFQPRCVLSPMDADFCVQFVRVMHLQGTPGFWTLTCYDRVSSLLVHLGDDLTSLPLFYQLLGDHVKNIVFSCSEYEARNYGTHISFLYSFSTLTVMLGRFLLGLLTDLLKWHQDEQQYLQDNRVKGSGKAAYLPGLQLRWTNKPTVAVSDLAKWSEVQQFNRKCHRKLVKVSYHPYPWVSPRLIASTLPQALIECIETGEFMHVYNAIIVLKEVLPVFPVAAASGTAGYSLVTVLDRLLEKEERGDLKILARAYHASLKKRESIWAIPTDHKSSHISMKVDSPARTSTPTGPGQDSRPAGQSTNPPSAPRSHISSVNNNIVAPIQPKANQPPNTTKAAMESVPRPDFIKRVGRGDKMDTTSDHSSTPETNKSSTPQPTKEPPTGPAKLTPPTQPRRASPVNTMDARKDLAHVKDQSRPPSPSGTNYPSSARDPHSPRGHRGPDERRDSPQTTMLPPTIPSQKPSAHELRETAKMTIGSRLPDKPDMDRPSSQHDQNGHPPRRRSNSPSRPGTRNPSLDSRGSAGQSRSAGEDERRDSRAGPSRRDSMRSERGARDRASGRDGRESDREDRERERERDRHGERERKERDRNERDNRERERERERDRERERERERDRDRNGGRDSRDRHRRDERDRKERPAARESTREQRDSGRESAREPTVVTPATPVETPTRPSDTTSRHRSAIKGEEGLGKRRRPADDDVSANPFHFASLPYRNP